MRRISLILVLFAALTNHCSALDRVQLAGYVLKSQRSWARTAMPQRFISQEEMPSEYLTFYPDGTYTLLRYDDHWTGFSTGRWREGGNGRITLDWDRSETEKVITEERRDKKYKLAYASFYIIIKDWTLQIRKDSLITVGFEGDQKNTVDKIDKLCSELDLITFRVEKRSQAITGGRGDSVGKQTDYYFFDSANRVIKYISQEKFIDKDGNDHHGTQLVYFLDSNYIKSITIPSYGDKQQKVYYYFGQKLIQGSTPDTAEDAYWHAMSIKNYIPGLE